MEKILLIIDDSKEIIDIVGEILGGFFDKVISAANVDEALLRLRENKCSFIVLDINLEGRNGAEVVKYLVDHPENPNRHTPVVILSGIINSQFAERYVSRFAGIVMKPFDHEKLALLVKDLMNEIPLPKCDLPFPVPQLEQKVAKVMETIKKSSKLKQLLFDMQIDRNADQFVLSHIGMVINISAAICMKMEWNTDKTLEKFVYAAYLHDMAINDRPDLARFNGGTIELELLKDKMTPADYKLIFEHATMAAKKIEETGEIPPDVSTMVLQHHENPKETGFPSRLPFAKITPLSTVFIVAHDLTHYILDNPKWNMKDYMQKTKTKYKGPHFAKVLSALNEMV